MNQSRFHLYFLDLWKEGSSPGRDTVKTPIQDLNLQDVWFVYNRLG